MMACVFRVFGDNLEIDALLQKLNMEPYRLWRKGEPRNPRFPEKKKNDCSGACFTASDAEMWEFPVQVEEATEFLKRHKKDIKTIVAFPNAEAALDFGIELKRNFLNCDYLPPELLRLAGNLGIGIELSHYAPTEEEDQIEEQS